MEHLRRENQVRDLSNLWRRQSILSVDRQRSLVGNGKSSGRTNSEKRRSNSSSPPRVRWLLSFLRLVEGRTLDVSTSISRQRRYSQTISKRNRSIATRQSRSFSAEQRAARRRSCKGVQKMFVSLLLIRWFQEWERKYKALENRLDSIQYDKDRVQTDHRSTQDENLVGWTRARMEWLHSHLSRNWNKRWRS